MLFMSLIIPLYLWIFPAERVIPTGPDIIYLLILSLACTTVPFILSLKALQKISAFTLNLSVNLEPVYSIILAIWLFGENKNLNAGFYAGTCVIMGSVILHTLYKYRKARTKIIPGT
jgi:drug/metabolite transporter (DMT)-like permease